MTYLYDRTLLRTKIDSFYKPITLYIPNADINRAINNSIMKGNVMQDLKKYSIDHDFSYKLNSELKKPMERVAIPLQTLIDKILELKIKQKKGNQSLMLIMVR